LNYEEFFADAQIHTKALKEKTAAQSKAVNKIQKCISDGDLSALPKLFSALRDAAREREDALAKLESLAESFDVREYMSNGDFAEQMIEYCRQMDVDVQGNFPVYEMFPCRITVNPETQDITIDRKRLQCQRPSKLVGDIKAELEKLSKVSFNAQLFAKELAAAYDLAILKASRKKACAADAPIYAIDLYEALTPMKRYKKEYTRYNFSYDIAHLYTEGNIALDDGRTLRFDTARDARKAIRILDGHGTEQFVTTIRFCKQPGGDAI
jgi:hypothetical protein